MLCRLGKSGSKAHFKLAEVAENGIGLPAAHELDRFKRHARAPMSGGTANAKRMTRNDWSAGSLEGVAPFAGEPCLGEVSKGRGGKAVGVAESKERSR